jgi:hypothetical protein
MAISLNPSEKSAGITFGVYKPASGYDIDDAVRHIRAAIASAEQAGSVRAAILSSVNGSWVAVFCDWRGAAPSLYDLSEEATAVLRKVDCGCFHLISSEPREASVAPLSVGDIVSVRRIYTDNKTQELLAYSCLAVLKAYFAQIKGLLSSAFYKSEDGMLIVGLSTWDNAGSASALLESCGGSPGEAYWRDLNAKKLKYEVCRVVYITRETAFA